METRKIECDKCKADLTTTPNCEGWRIVLAPERVTSRGQYVTLLMVYPELAQPHHFCSMACLKGWLEDGYVSARPTISTRLCGPSPSFSQES